MPFRRLTGSDDSIRQAAATRSAGAFAMRRAAHAQMANSMQARLARERNWSTGHDHGSQEAASSLLENDVANGGGRIGRPHFARLHASIAERPLDWAWQHSPDIAKASGKSERSEGRPAGTGSSTRALWFGGIAFVLLAAGIISAVATVQSSRPLPFETWARLDLLRRADGTPGATATTALARGQFAGAPEGAPMAKAGPVAARHHVIAALAGVVAAREPGEVDAALASDARLEPSHLEVAGLGPILASAAAAEQVAANFAMLSLITAGVGSGAERLLAEPPRPVFKPALVSSSQPNETAREPSRP
jgi:hypothetical protein